MTGIKPHKVKVAAVKRDPFERVTVIVEPHASFRNYLTRKHGMKYNAGSPTVISNLGEATGCDLFGGAHLYVLNCDSKEEFESVTRSLKKVSGEPWGGLIITTSSTPKMVSNILNRLKRMGCEIIKPETGKDRFRTILEKEGFSPSIVSKVSEYAGEELGHLVPLLEHVIPMSKRDIRLLSMEQVQPYLPMSPGERAPWALFDAIIDRNIPLLLRVIERSSGGFTLPLTVLKSRAREAMHAALILSEHPEYSAQKLAKEMGCNAFVAKPLLKTVQKAGLSRIIAIESILGNYLQNPERDYSMDSLKLLVLKLAHT